MKFLCKQFEIDFKRVDDIFQNIIQNMFYGIFQINRVAVINFVVTQEQELMKYMLEQDTDNSGTLDFEEFKVPARDAYMNIFILLILYIITL